MNVARNVYSKIIEQVFFNYFRAGDTEVTFDRQDLVAAAVELGIAPPKNLGDVIYTVRSRQLLPSSIALKAPPGTLWIITPQGKGKYAFSARIPIDHAIDDEEISVIPDCTPPLVRQFATSDEQALLSKIRYSRLIDVFTGLTCFSLQSHLRTSVPNLGQIETDEVYVGIDMKGELYVLPVQAKGIRDILASVQIEQDIEMCRHKFPKLTCKAVGVKQHIDDLVALYEYEVREDELRVLRRAYFLVSV